MIDIVIPTYNEEKYIGTLCQILKEKLTIDYRLIVTDDMSKDSTVSIAKKYADTVLEAKEKHVTIGANRNEGARQGTSDIIVFLDSDVILKDPDSFFALALERFQKENDLVALTGALRVVEKDETLADRIVYLIFNLVHYLKNNVFGVGESSGKFQMVRRPAFEKINGYDEKLVSREDADLFQRLVKAGGRVAYDGKLMVYHSGRRSRAYGWPKLLYIWFRDAFYVARHKKSASKEWEAVR